MTVTSAFIVMGYNNTRLGDVKKIAAYAREFHGAELVLCKNGISETDRSTVRHCVESDLRATEESVDAILGYLRTHAIELVGVLPFADRGVPIGALLARRLGLPGADPAGADGAFDKHVYRTREQHYPDLPEFHRTIRAREIGSVEQARAFWDEVAPQPVFLKPKGEGNSRGCTRVDQAADLDRAFSALRPYLAGGVMAEECVDGAREYSVDHVAGFSWLTEKATTSGAYRAEVQQIVPAPLAERTADRIRLSGFTAAEICGYGGSAFHNEIFLLPDGLRTAVVEPNLRPAGMRIWDLAALAFDFDPWAAWLDSARYGKPAPEFVDRRGFAGIRMLRSGTDGVLTALPDVSALPEEFPALREVVLTKAVGDRVTTLIEDNADFIGFVICASPSYQETRATLFACAEKIENSTGVEA
jgi:hypothetical protein